MRHITAIAVVTFLLPVVQTALVAAETCPDPKMFVACPAIGEVFAPAYPGIIVYADCSGRPQGFKRTGPNIPSGGVHLINDRCGTATSSDPNINDRPCGYFQRGDSCDQGER